MLKAALRFTGIHMFRYYRLISDLGIARIIILIVLLAVALKNATSILHPHIIAFFLVFTVVFTHARRNDRILLSNAGLDKRFFFATIYLLALIPAFVYFITGSHYVSATILASGATIAAFLPYNTFPVIKIKAVSFRFIPAIAWEWRAGIRRYYLLIASIYLLIFLFRSNDLIYPASLLLMSILVMSFQHHNEPLSFIASLQLSYKIFLLKKVKTQVTGFLLLTAPIAIWSLLTFPANYAPVLLIVINSLIIQILVVAFRYAAYAPAETAGYVSIIGSIMHIFFIMPALLPVPLVLLFVFAHRALKNLKNVQYVFNQ